MNADREHDRRLAARAGAGDEHAFAELVARHREPLRRYVARRFGADLAEDAVQEALLAAHRALLAGTVPVDVRAWLSTIAWRRALDMCRRERDALPLDAAVPGNAFDEPEARAIQANELGRVVAAMSELPQRQRKALALSALEGRSLSEIGAALNVEPEVAKSLVARSRRTLTHRLAAADLGCDAVRVRMEAAAARGVRLPGDVTLHLRGCRVCARAHREIRRRRVALLIPLGLIVRTAGVREKLRDLIAFNPAWDAQLGAAKMCTAACLSTLAAGTAAPAVAPVVAVPSQATATPTPEKKRKRPRATPTPTAVPTAVATVVLARPTPVATATPPAKKAKPVKKQRRPAKRHPAAVSFPAGGEWQRTPNGTRVLVARAAKPTPTPTPVATPPPVATPAPTCGAVPEPANCAG
jgi:RNA polymerase sigma-70 factor (ECF subfamily)